MKPAADDICELLRLMLWDAAASYVCAADHPQQAPRVYLLGVFDAYCRALSAAGDHETPFEITLVGI